MWGARRVRIERGIEGIAAAGGGRDDRGQRRCILRAHLSRRPWRAFSVRILQTPVAVLLHATDLIFQLLISELKLLNDPGELPNLAFQPLEPKQKIRRSRLGGVLRGRLRRRALTAQPFAAAKNNIEQAAGALAVLRPCRANRRAGARHEGKGEQASKGEAGHGSSSVRLQVLAFKI